MLQPAPTLHRDFYPEDMRRQEWLFDTWRSVAKRFGFEEYDSPVLEHESLYIRKAGEEVTQQLYNFEDKGGRRLSLRPEMTPSLARMVMSKRNALPFPLKWFSFPQCWRYERMTRGRRREHYQWNMDIWGVAGVEAEAELLAAVVTSFVDMGITSSDVGIKVNSRKLLADLMRKYGVTEEQFAPACVLVDKLEKIPLDAIQGELEALGLSVDDMRHMLAMLQRSDMDEFARELGEECEGVADLKRLFSLAEAYGIHDWLDFDASVVRGLSYYTGVVFEGFDRSGELRAICGGGRYDTLLESFGGEAVPAVGFGFGDAVIMELLMAKKRLPDFKSNGVEVMVYAMSEALRPRAIAMCRRLRAAGLTVDLVLDARKPKWAFQRADKVGTPLVVMYADDEAARGQAILKNLKTSEQQAVDEGDLVNRVALLLADLPDAEET